MAAWRGHVGRLSLCACVVLLRPLRGACGSCGAVRTLVDPEGLGLRAAAGSQSCDLFAVCMVPRVTILLIAVGVCMGHIYACGLLKMNLEICNHMDGRTGLFN